MKKLNSIQMQNTQGGWLAWAILGLIILIDVIYDATRPKYE
jgi:hypothetical protein